jgi:hypothetical protein
VKRRGGRLGRRRPSEQDGPLANPGHGTKPARRPRPRGKEVVPDMKGRCDPGEVCPAALVECPAVAAGGFRWVGGPRLGPVVSLRRVSPGDQGQTGPVRPPGPFSHALE